MHPKFTASPFRLCSIRAVYTWISIFTKKFSWLTIYEKKQLSWTRSRLHVVDFRINMLNISTDKRVSCTRVIPAWRSAEMVLIIDVAWAFSLQILSRGGVIFGGVSFISADAIYPEQTIRSWGFIIIHYYSFVSLVVTLPRDGRIGGLAHRAAQWSKRLQPNFGYLLARSCREWDEKCTSEKDR